MQDGRGANDSREMTPFDEPVEDDANEAAEEGQPYFPPTDPVIAVDEQGVARIEGGFGQGEAEHGAPARAETGTAASDEALADAIRRELRLDASTASLDVRVNVREGVATLRGEVTDMADDENAVAVAGRVAGVVDVVDELEVA